MKPFAVGLVLLGIAPALASSRAQARDLTPFVRGSWQQIREAHAGQPVIVHFWGLTCGPCRIEMPEWGKLLDEKPALKLVIIHAERLHGSPSQVSDMLAASGLARADNWMFSENFQEPLRFEIDPKWQGELPRTMLIGRDGAISTVTGSADLAHVRGWIAAQTQPGG